MEKKIVNGIEWHIEPTEHKMLEKYDGIVSRDPKVLFDIKLLEKCQIKHPVEQVVQITEDTKLKTLYTIEGYQILHYGPLPSNILRNPISLVNALYNNKEGKPMFPPNGDWHQANLAGSSEECDFKVFFMKMNAVRGMGIILKKKGSEYSEIVDRYVARFLEKRVSTEPVSVAIKFNPESEFISRFYVGPHVKNVEDRLPEFVQEYDVHQFSFRIIKKFQ
ncbi:MAG: hypothetical protein ACRCX8_03515 [Sarcina sp.]